VFILLLLVFAISCQIAVQDAGGGPCGGFAAEPGAETRRGDLCFCSLSLICSLSRLNASFAVWGLCAIHRLQEAELLKRELGSLHSKHQGRISFLRSPASHRWVLRPLVRSEKRGPREAGQGARQGAEEH
jgi:hypothetical protein